MLAKPARGRYHEKELIARHVYGCLINENTLQLFTYVHETNEWKEEDGPFTSIDEEKQGDVTFLVFNKEVMEAVTRINSKLGFISEKNPKNKQETV